MSEELKQEALKEMATDLSAAQAEFSGVSKSGENKYDKYRYATLEDFVQVAKPVLAKHGFSVVTSVEEVIPIADRQTKGGTTEYVVRVKLLLRLVHKSGAMVETTSYGEGQDRADKAIYKAITGARKYGLASLLGLATTDDPEADEKVGRDDVTKQTSTIPKPLPAKTADVPTPPPTNVATDPEPSTTASALPAEGAPATGADAADPALLQAKGPCADCSKSDWMDKFGPTFIRRRGKGEQVRWSHNSFPKWDCEKVAKAVEAQAKSK